MVEKRVPKGSANQPCPHHTAAGPRVTKIYGTVYLRPEGLVYKHQIRYRSTCGGTCSSGQPPHHKGAGIQSPQIFGTLSTPILFDLETPNLVGSHMLGTSVFSRS